MAAECGGKEGGAAGCDKCLDEHRAAIDAAECDFSEQSAFCAASSVCTRALEAACAQATRNMTLCTACLDDHHVAIDAAGCGYTQESAFCGGPRPPAPPGPPPLDVAQTLYERAVVNAKEGMGHELGHLQLLHPHKHVDFVRLPPAWLEHSSLVLARVAGYDNASFGLPTGANLTWPLLAQPTSHVMVASTQLSYCRRRRFAPSARWMAVVKAVLAHVSGGTWRPRDASAPLWTPSVTASFGRHEVLPPDAERQALIRGVRFFRTGKLMPDALRAEQLSQLKCETKTDAGTARECAQFMRLAPPFNHSHGGDGQLGIFEGYSSDIDIHGRQPIGTAIRCDCTTETSASFAAAFAVGHNVSDEDTAISLLSYGHHHAGFSQQWLAGATHDLDTADGRAWLLTGDAFGLMSWGSPGTGYHIYYKDDDARGLLGAVVTAALLRSERWHSTIAVGVLANLRQVARNGFGPSSGTNFSTMVGADYSNKEGWRQVYDAPEYAPRYSPHYEAYIWAVMLWGYRHSGFAPLLRRPQEALRIMMANYPSKWVPTANGIAMQRARIILPLAFLVRVNDTALHRAWLTTAIDGLLERAHCEGTWCALREELSHDGWGGGTTVPDNENYGTFEAPLNQHNDDPVSDFLYTSNFALLGLHEAAAAMPDNATIRRAEDRLVDFIVRLQPRSRELPFLDGAFFRAFDYEKWEAWGSDADLGWGAWSVETGWTQSWITTVLGLRQLNTSVWELGGELRSIKRDFQRWLPIMRSPRLPGPASGCLARSARDDIVARPAPHLRALRTTPPQAALGSPCTQCHDPLWVSSVVQPACTACYKADQAALKFGQCPAPRFPPRDPPPPPQPCDPPLPCLHQEANHTGEVKRAAGLAWHARMEGGRWGGRCVREHPRRKTALAECNVLMTL